MQEPKSVLFPKCVHMCEYECICVWGQREHLGVLDVMSAMVGGNNVLFALFHLTMKILCS